MVSTLAFCLSNPPAQTPKRFGQSGSGATTFDFVGCANKLPQLINRAISCILITSPVTIDCQSYATAINGRLHVDRHPVNRSAHSCRGWTMHWERDVCYRSARVMGVTSGKCVRLQDRGKDDVALHVAV
jgi:hypothetical protein